MPPLEHMPGSPANRSAIRSPVPSTARVDLEDGFEYCVAEMGSASGRATGPIDLTFEGTYGQFAHIHLGNSGIVR
jgi:hypothetical protein